MLGRRSTRFLGFFIIITQFFFCEFDLVCRFRVEKNFNDLNHEVIEVKNVESDVVASDNEEDIVENSTSVDDDKDDSDEISLDYRLTMTAEFCEHLGEVEKIVVTGIAEDENAKKDTAIFKQAFDRQKHDFLKEIQAAKKIEDDEFVQAKKKALRMDSILSSFKNAENYLIQLEREKKITPKESLSLRAKIVFAIFDEIGLKVDELNTKVVLDQISCQRLIDSLLIERHQKKTLTESSPAKEKNEEELKVKVQKVLSLETEVLALTDKINSLELDLSKAKKTEENLKHESKKNKELLQKLSQADLEKKALKQDFLRKENDTKVNEEKLQEKLKNIATELSTSESKLKDSFAEKMMLQDRIQKVLDEMMSVKKDLSTAEAQLGSKELKNQSMEVELKREVALRTTAETKKELAEKTIVDLNQKVSDQDKQIAEKAQNILLLEKNAKHVSASLEQVKIDNQTLQEKLKTSKTQAASLLEKNKDLEKNLNKKNDELFGLQISIGKLSKEREQLLQKNVKLSEEKNQILLMKNELAKELKNQLHKLQKKEAEIEKISLKRDALEGKLSHLQERIVRLELFSEQKKATDKNESKVLQKQLAELGGGLDKVTSEIEKAQQDRKEIIVNLKNLEQKHAEKKAIEENLNHQHQLAIDKIDDVNKKIKDHENAISQATVEQNKFEKMLNNSKADLQKKADDIKKIESTVLQGPEPLLEKNNLEAERRKNLALAHQQKLESSVRELSQKEEKAIDHKKEESDGQVLLS